MDCSIPGFSVFHHLPELAQTHVHWAGDAIHQSHPLSSPSYLAFNLSHHQGLFQWVFSSHQVAKVLELQHQSFEWNLIFKIFKKLYLLEVLSEREEWYDIRKVKWKWNSPLTLCDQVDYTVHGILQARILEWVPITFPMHACTLSRFSRVWLCATLQTAAHQAPLSIGFSRQEYWSGLPFPSPFSHISYQYSILVFCGAMVYRSCANVILTGYMSPCLCFYSCLLHLWEYTGPALHLPQPSGLSRPQRTSLSPEQEFSRIQLSPN